MYHLQPVELMLLRNLSAFLPILLRTLITTEWNSEKYGMRFSVRASEKSSVVPSAEILIGQIGPRSFSLVRLVPEAEILIGCRSPRKIITVTCGDKIEGKLHHAQLVLAKF